ncbi:class I SAM-dependent methyltransferase [Bradyrhizobium lupini]|uniref:class I SAM-dependent methyltransferase n=1 Tax=Rhizobium lupini TaxID=136996 RepID=UPI0034C5EE7F
MDAMQKAIEQMRLWNGPAGRAWVETQDILDEMFKQFERPLCEAVPAGSNRRVLDVGCGTGGLTVAVARKLGQGGRVVGIDISAPMIGAALARAEREGTSASFICADAQHHKFDPASFDTIISRLGVMFFEDLVAAFANLEARCRRRRRARRRCMAGRSGESVHDGGRTSRRAPSAEYACPSIRRSGAVRLR